MSIFNMAIQMFVVLSSYKSIDRKFKKTGQAKVKYSLYHIRHVRPKGAWKEQVYISPHIA